MYGIHRRSSRSLVTPDRKEEVLLRHIEITAKKGHDFGSDRSVEFKFLQEFPETIFLIITMESLLVEEDVLSCQTRIIAEKGHNFWSDRLIALKFLQEFPEAIFLVVPMDSLLVELKVLSLEIEKST